MTWHQTDQPLQQAIRKRLDWSPDVDSEHIGVAVTAGAVTLSGEAVSATEKAAAVRAAIQVQGVAAVVDEIVVRSAAGAVNDADIARATQAMLERHPKLRGGRVTATVHHHVVTLRGAVDSIEQGRAAHRAAEAILGVRTVIDEFELTPAPTVAQARAKLAEVLSGGVETELAHLDVAMDGHVVTLQGTVHSWYERRAAERAARSVPGVADVHNNLVVSF